MEPSKQQSPLKLFTMLSLQSILRFLFLFFLCLSLNTAIILDENGIKDLCNESRSSEVVTSEVINRFMKRFNEHFSRSVENFPDKSIDELLIKSLIDDFKRSIRPDFGSLGQPDADEDRSIVAKYKIKQKKYASTDMNDLIAIQNGQITSNSGITMRQTHDKIKGSDVNKKIIFIEPEFSLGRSRRAATMMEAHQDGSITTINRDQSSPNYCENLKLSEPLDSSSSMKWWAGVHSLRKQLGLIA